MAPRRRKDALDKTVDKLQSLTTQIRQTRDSARLVALTKELRRTAEQFQRIARAEKAAAADPATPAGT